jgi:hypothetical protein
MDWDGQWRCSAMKSLLRFIAALGLAKGKFNVFEPATGIA